MGCVYLLEDCNGNGYIGKTKDLKRRLNNHRCSGNETRSRYLDNFKCLVLEQFEDEDDLDNAEQFYYDLYKDLYGDKIVNYTRPLQTRKEWSENTEYYKQYYKNNKEELLEKLKEYCENNKEKIKERKKGYYEKNKEKMKEYRENNKEQIKERMKEYYKNNKEKIKQKITCVCGSVINYGEKSQHIKTKKHQNYISTNN